uniref:Uncharacterized protein n=1 Tax=viral metagenome TaxID=1070528 RepID=A0A6M3LMU2_9ZZZZ
MMTKCEHDARFHLMLAANGCCACELEARMSEVERLRAIVDKLPKCWRLDESGRPVQDCPVILGETELWITNGVANVPAFSIGKALAITIGVSCGPPWVTTKNSCQRRLSECGNSPEAAEKARE